MSDGTTDTPYQSIVTDDMVGTRLDRFVATHFTDISRTRAQALIDAGSVVVNGATAKVSYSLEIDDVVSLKEIIAPVESSLPIAEDLPITVVYEDAHLIVIDKLAGMVVHPAPGHASGTLVNALLGHTDELGNAESIRPGIVHRLDKDTSGLLVVAKDDVAMLGLAQQMRDHSMNKVYIALVEGMLDPPNGAIEAPIGRDPSHRQRMAIVSQGGRDARTLYSTERVVRGRSLLRVTLVTGRTHQIRVHFTAVGHPVVGDIVYGINRKPLPPRQFLHAAELSLTHPITQERLHFVSPLPAELAEFLEQLSQE